MKSDIRIKRTPGHKARLAVLSLLLVISFGPTASAGDMELRIKLPKRSSLTPVQRLNREGVEAIQKNVVEATSETSKQAENEWRHAAHSRDMSALSAAPSINVKPVIGGVEIGVRYITKASERSQLRSKIYQAAVDLLGQKSGVMVSTPEPPKP